MSRRGASLAVRLSLSHLVVALASVGAVTVAVWILGAGAADRYITFIESLQERVGFVPPGIAQQQAGAAAQLRDQLAMATLLAASVATVVSLALALFLARDLIAPVRAAAAAARRVSAGERRVAVPSAGVSELDELGEALERLGRDLEATERQRDRLVDDVMHELRTPLSIVRGHLEALRDGVMPADPALIGRVLDALQRIEQLVADLRSSTELSTASLDRRPTSAQALLADARDRHRLTAARGNVRLETHDATDGATVSVDRSRFGQVLDNLLDNAIAHAPPASTVTIAGHTEHGELVVEITDRGPGIAPDHQALVFERLYRGDSARDRRTGGAGIGLAIARRVVEAHGGVISVRSEPGQGATFTVRVPLTEN